MQPERPGAILRVGFAGRRELSESESLQLEALLTKVLATLGEQLAAIHDAVPFASRHDSQPAGSSHRPCPVLRLITGLCEGADALAGRVLERISVSAKERDQAMANMPRFTTELVAVLPFDVAGYRATRPESFWPEFDRQLANCASVTTLNGTYEAPTADSALTESLRTEGYRAQAIFLLSHSDLLVAATNPKIPTQPGGTLDTVRNAVAAELPVVFLHTGNGGLHMIEPGGDFRLILTQSLEPVDQWQSRLKQWVTQVLKDQL